MGALEDRIKAAVQALADVVSDIMKVSMGTPGAYQDTAIGVQKTGQAWISQTPFALLVAGLSQVIELAPTSVTSSRPIAAGENVLIFNANGITLSAPAAASNLIGSYIVINKTSTSVDVDGTINGAPVTIPVTTWTSLQLYCDGTDWIAW